MKFKVGQRVKSFNNQKGIILSENVVDDSFWYWVKTDDGHYETFERSELTRLRPKGVMNRD